MTGSRRFVEFVKFNLVGLLNTAVDFIVFTVLIGAGVHLLAAQTIGYACGVGNSYVWNKYWTFKKVAAAEERPSAGADRPSAGPSGERARIGRFVALNVVSLLLSLLILLALDSWLNMPALVAKAFATAVTVVVNYAGSRRWVFR